MSRAVVIRRLAPEDVPALTTAADRARGAGEFLASSDPHATSFLRKRWARPVDRS